MSTKITNTTKKNKTPLKTNLSAYNGKVLNMSFDMWISGTKLAIDKKQCINSIEIKETVEGSDSATIKISDPEFRFLDDNIFLENNTVKIQLGWSDTTYKVTFEGYISLIDIVFDSSGVPYLTVYCMDKTHKMNREKKSKTYSNCTSASVVKKIVKSYGFKFVTDSSYKFAKQASISQSNQSDIDFITKLAADEVHPFTARLVGDTFYYTKIGKLTTPKLEMSYRDYPHDIISFNPRINKESKQKISASSVNSGSKSTSSSSSGGGGGGSNSSSSSGGSGSSSSSSSPTSKKSGGGYTYNPATKSWSHN